jgi:hypothetical protein
VKQLLVLLGTPAVYMLKNSFGAGPGVPGIVKRLPRDSDTQELFLGAKRYYLLL